MLNDHKVNHFFSIRQIFSQLFCRGCLDCEPNGTPVISPLCFRHFEKLAAKVQKINDISKFFLKIIHFDLSNVDFFVILDE